MYMRGGGKEREDIGEKYSHTNNRERNVNDVSSDGHASTILVSD